MYYTLEAVLGFAFKDRALITLRKVMSDLFMPIVSLCMRELGFDSKKLILSLPAKSTNIIRLTLGPVLV